MQYKYLYQCVAAYIESKEYSGLAYSLIAVSPIDRKYVLPAPASPLTEAQIFGDAPL